MYEIQQSSPKALEEPTGKGRGYELKYPWNKLTVGNSFAIPFAEHKLNNLRSYVIRMGHKYGKKFKVVVHEESQLYEIACIQVGLPVIPEGRRPKKVPIEPAKIVNGWFEGPLPAGWGTINGDEGK